MLYEKRMTSGLYIANELGNTFATMNITMRSYDVSQRKSLKIGKVRIAI
jgi:hypothetical protein